MQRKASVSALAVLLLAPPALHGVPAQGKQLAYAVERGAVSPATSWGPTPSSPAA